MRSCQQNAIICRTIKNWIKCSAVSFNLLSTQRFLHKLNRYTVYVIAFRSVIWTILHIAGLHNKWTLFLYSIFPAAMREPLFEPDINMKT